MKLSSYAAAALLVIAAAPALAIDYKPPFAPIVGIGGKTRLIYPMFPVELLASESETNGQFGMVVVYTLPNEGPQENAMLEYKLTETYYVLDGRYEFFMGDERYEGGPGTVIVNPPNVPHSFNNIGSEVGRLLVLFTPEDGSRGTGFYTGWADMAQRTPAWIAKTNKAYGIDRPVP